MDNGDKYALQRQAMLQRQALELRLVPVAASGNANARKPSLQTVQSALARLNAELAKQR